MDPKIDKTDTVLKCILIGDTSVGKSCLLHQFIENRCKEESNQTVGVEFGTKKIEIGDRHLKFQIWDTAGQERYRAVTRSYYRGAVGALIVYDITNRDSFEHLGSWLSDARTWGRTDISIIIIGNKMDLQDHRQVKFLEASCFALDNDAIFDETSAMSGENVESAFLKLASVILGRAKQGDLDLQEDTKKNSHVKLFTQGPKVTSTSRFCRSCG